MISCKRRLSESYASVTHFVGRHVRAPGTQSESSDTDTTKLRDTTQNFVFDEGKLSIRVLYIVAVVYIIR